MRKWHTANHCDKSCNHIRLTASKTCEIPNHSQNPASYMLFKESYKLTPVSVLFEEWYFKILKSSLEERKRGWGPQCCRGCSLRPWDFTCCSALVEKRNEALVEKRNKCFKQSFLILFHNYLTLFTKTVHFMVQCLNQLESGQDIPLLPNLFLFNVSNYTKIFEEK